MKMLVVLLIAIVLNFGHGHLQMLAAAIFFVMLLSPLLGLLPPRRWEIIMFPYWQFHIHKSFGDKYGPAFLKETWVGPFCFRLWSDPRSVGSVSRAIYKARGM